jgi:hypothetical protein
MFCSSQGDAVSKFLIPYTRRIADAPLDAVPQINWGNVVLTDTYKGLCREVSKGRSEKAILLGCPLLLQLWFHERSTIGQPVISLQPYEDLPEGHDPADRFTMGSLWCLRTVISYLSLHFDCSIHI